MQNQAKKQKQMRAGMLETVFCWSMLLFAIFEIIFLAVVLGRAFRLPSDPSNDDPFGDGTEPSQSVTTTGSPIVTPSTPVFSGGIVPAYPTGRGAASVISGIQSEYAVLIEVDTGKIVAQKQSAARFSPASMTKVMTLIVATEQLTTDQLDEKLTMTQAMYDYARADHYADSTLYGIDVDDQYSVRDLLYGIGMRSASDCVIPIVMHVSETEEAFVALMNEKVNDLKLKDTHFDNAIGYESDGNYTTAEDMAVMMMYAMQNDLIADILGKEVHRSTAAGYAPSGEFDPSFDITFYSTLFGDHDASRMTAYKKHYGKAFSLQTTELVAGKTGWTADNYCLVSYAVKDAGGTEYVLVLGEAQKKYETLADVKAILDTYLN